MESSHQPWALRCHRLFPCAQHGGGHDSAAADVCTGTPDGVCCEPLYYYRYCEMSLSHADGAAYDARLIRQMLDMEANLVLVERFFRDWGLESRFHKAIVFRKFFDKRWVLPALHTSRDCRLWRRCHPDINIVLYGNGYISLSEKLTSILVQIGVYPWVRKIIRRR